MDKKQWKSLYSHKIKLHQCYCILCGKPILKQKDLSLEHLQPLSRGGKDDPSNWFPAHMAENFEKGSLTFDEYKQWKYLELLRNGAIKEK